MKIFESIADLIKTYTAALPTSVVAVILIIVRLKVGKLILKVIGLILIAVAIFFFIKKI